MTQLPFDALTLIDRSDHSRLVSCAVSGDYEAFWSTIPAKADHPVRVPMLEALWRIGEPLSATTTVDVLDGEVVDMWDAAHHLEALEALDVVEPLAGGTGRGTSGQERFDLPYRLKHPTPGGDR